MLPAISTQMCVSLASILLTCVILDASDLSLPSCTLSLGALEAFNRYCDPVKKEDEEIASLKDDIVSLVVHGFCVRRAQGNTFDRYRAAGYPTAVIEGETRQEMRRWGIKEFGKNVSWKLSALKNSFSRSSNTK